DNVVNILHKYEDFFNYDATCIVYAGALTKGRDIDKLIDAVNELGSQYKLLIVGYGDYEYELNSKIKKVNNKNIISIGSVPYSDLAAVIQKCDIGYLYYSNKGLNNIYCAPN